VPLDRAGAVQPVAGQFGGESFASRQGYADAKSDFIDRVVRLALG